MSGTSVDGLDLCYSAFTKTEHHIWNFEILKTETYAYPEAVSYTHLRAHET